RPVVTFTASPAVSRPRSSKAPPPVWTVCPVMIAEPLAAPGTAPSDHQPTRRGFDGGMSAPPRARIPSTRAEMPRLGTVTLTGFVGRVAVVLLVSRGGVLLELVAFDDVFDEGFAGTATVVPAGRGAFEAAGRPAALGCRPSAVLLELSCW